ncbi:hypothetical protein BDZ91DRAFT_712242 [Kalaharituber pfeilii]|nr:hypothetical protein BDZ91DRAFT_712242 [Kalaharituber pfeilii]
MNQKITNQTKENVFFHILPHRPSCRRKPPPPAQNQNLSRLLLACCTKHTILPQCQLFHAL